MNRIAAQLAGFLLTVTGLMVCATCGKSPSASTDTASTASDSESRAGRVVRDVWDIYRLQGKRIGYGQTTVTRQAEAGRDVIITEGTNHIVMQRGGQTASQDIRTKSIELPEGQLLRFDNEMRMGASPIKMVGRVHGDRLDLEITGPGATVAKHDSVPWSAAYRGPFACEQTLLERPMKPGEHRELKMLMPGPDGVEVADVAMTAKSFEDTPYLNGTRNLLRIETITRLSGGAHIDGVAWSDRSGETLKNVAAGLEQYRVDKATALEKHDAAELDLVSTMSVQVERPIPNAHHTKRARYRVHLDDGDPASVFTAGASQAIKSIDRHTAEITVYAIRPGEKDGNAAAMADPPTDDNRRPNSFVQSDDPTIVADARKAAGDETDPWRVAVALERYVNREVKLKNFTQAFASAAEVAKSHEGDCTEHAVFLAALARARGIPARVAVGLVYMQQAAAFGYHMWTEVYIDKRWIPIDGTLALGGIGAAHLQITHTSLQAASAYSAFLPVVQVLGRLKIQVLDVE